MPDILAAQACPVCANPIQLQVPPRRWIHTHQPCTSPTYDRLCDPTPFATGCADDPLSVAARAKVRGRTRRNQYLARARGSNSHGPIQALRDDQQAKRPG